jgi:hypothetical protein
MLTVNTGPAGVTQSEFFNVMCRDEGPCSQPGITGHKTKKLVKTTHGARTFIPKQEN